MAKKGRGKKNKQEKQRNDPEDDNNRRNSLSSRTVRYSDISSLIYHQIIPSFLRIRKSDQEKEYNHVDIPKRNSDNNMDPNDLISRLPDNILHRIISFLPFESAVRTCFLSTHWKHLWKEALLDSVLDVNTIEAANKAIQSFLNEFDTHHRPKNKWGFIFEFSHGKGFLIATISSKAALQLDFSADKQEFPRPFDLFLKLNLASPNRLSDRFDWLLEENHPVQNPQPPSNTMKLKSLHLISISHLSNMSISSLVPNLPFLRNLTISKCNGLQSLQILEAKGLLKLVVLDCPHLQSLSFEGFRLKSFRYRGNLVSFKFQLSCKCYLGHNHICECGLSLEDVMLDIRQGPLTQWTWDCEKTPNYYLYERTLCGCADKKKCLKSILRSIKGVKALTICRWFFETSMCMTVTFGFCLSGLKELWWIDCSMERESINALLCFLELCPSLETLHVIIDPKCYKLPRTGKFSALVNVLHKLDYLKVVKLEGFADERMENFMARRLIHLFRENSDPVIISKSDGKCLKNLVKVAKWKKKGKYPYKFEMVENVDQNYFPDHMNLSFKLDQ